jgi:cytochrome P450
MADVDVRGLDLEDVVRAFMEPPFVEDPYPCYDALREAAPVFRSETGLWFASSYDASLTVFRSPAFGQGAQSARLRGDGRFADSPAFRTLAHMLPFIDPPDHTRLRRLISRAFTPRAIERMRSYLVSSTDELIDDIEAAGGGDVMSQLANHVPVGVICEMLGAGHERHDDLVRWSDDLVGAVHPMVNDDDLLRADRGAAEFRSFVLELIAARRIEPRDDLLTALVQAQEGDDILTADELVSTVVLFIGAGIENTKHYIGSCIEYLLRDPVLLSRVRSDPELRAAALEEVLRLEPPVQIAVPRVALSDTDIGGVPVPAGAAIAVVIGGANRDPAVYPDPLRLDPQRSGPPNLSLASGPHLCAGAALARLEANVVVDRFVQRLPRAELTVADPAARDEGRPSVRGLAELPIRLP